MYVCNPFVQISTAGLSEWLFAAAMMRYVLFGVHCVSPFTIKTSSDLSEVDWWLVFTHEGQLNGVSCVALTQIEFLDALPKTESGKTQRSKLRKKEWSTAAANA